MSRVYESFKGLLPHSLREFLSGINQRWFARRTLLRKYGGWFDVDWREKFSTLSNEEWKSAYDRAWKNRGNDCVDEHDAALFLNALSEPGSVLDVGCGAGGLAIRLSQAGHRVTGMDVSEEALRLAADAGGKAGVTVEWRIGFAEKLPFPDQSFDYLVSTHTLEHVRELMPVVSEFKRVARKKILILTPKQSYKRYMDNYHTQFFETSDQLSRIFGLHSFTCAEIDAGGPGREFQGKAWFYIGSVTSR
ncbi:MAG: class I SAM-dependent methyltransferase [Bacteroidota bacterium]